MHCGVTGSNYNSPFLVLIELLWTGWYFFIFLLAAFLGRIDIWMNLFQRRMNWYLWPPLYDFWGQKISLDSWYMSVARRCSISCKFTLIAFLRSWLTSSAVCLEMASASTAAYITSLTDSKVFAWALAASFSNSSLVTIMTYEAFVMWVWIFCQKVSWTPMRYVFSPNILVTPTHKLWVAVGWNKIFFQFLVEEAQ